MAASMSPGVNASRSEAERPDAKIRNSKSEIRNKSEIRSAKFETQQPENNQSLKRDGSQTFAFSRLGFSIWRFRICFEFRISSFEFS